MATSAWTPVPEIDYEALAKKYGAVSSQPAQIDYEALAKQYGAISSEPPPPGWTPVDEPAAQPEPDYPPVTGFEAYGPTLQTAAGRENQRRVALKT